MVVMKLKRIVRRAMKNSNWQRESWLECCDGMHWSEHQLRTIGVNPPVAFSSEL